MKIQTYTNIVKEDFPQEAQQTMAKLAPVLNTCFNNLYNVINGNVSIDANIFGFIKIIDITTNALGVPIGTSTFKLQNNVLNPKGIQVIRAVSSRTGVFPTGAPFISYTLINNPEGTLVSINHVTGLPANTTFSLSLLVYG